jgi:uncharacterized repeat protein (TIGR03803 family)
MRTVFTLATALMLAAALGPGQSRAANLTTLYNFCSLANCTDGAVPYTGLIIDANGNLFGTTTGGGNSTNCPIGCGTVFEIVNNGTRAAPIYASSPKILVSFCTQPSCTDGRDPQGSLIADANGNLFGTTKEGGNSTNCPGLGCGTVFEIANNGPSTAPSYASSLITLVSFCALPYCADGEEPNPGLIADPNGNLFGTTLGGGAHLQSCFGGPCGTVFEIVNNGTRAAPSYASSPKTLVSFCALPNCADGYYPTHGLIADANGNLFGTTLVGGEYGRGTVFEIVNNGPSTAPSYASSLITLVSFCVLPYCADGQQPASTLIAGAVENLFGTTTEGGGQGSNGTAFEIAKTPGTPTGYASTPTTLISFNFTDGSAPLDRLVADPNGNLFGTTTGGGACRAGTVFEITSSGFIPPSVLAGTPGNPNCIDKSVSGLAQAYGGFAHAAAALGNSIQRMATRITRMLSRIRPRLHLSHAPLIFG